MYFYEIEVYYPFCENEKIIMSHDGCFDNHQLNIIVQEAFDECIEKYIDKSVLDKGEEACRIEVGTIFEKHLPSQLKNHGFKNIKINETCSIMGGMLFCNNGVNNPVLMDRYKNEVLPPCKKCMREAYFDYNGNCIVSNERKDNSLPTTHVVKTIPIDLKEEENKDDFNISILKQYFTNSNRSVEDSKIANVALENILGNNDFEGYRTKWGTKADGIHEGDIICDLDGAKDRGKFKKMLKNYGFIFKDTRVGLWITGVKE